MIRLYSLITITPSRIQQYCDQTIPTMKITTSYTHQTSSRRSVFPRPDVDIRPIVRPKLLTSKAGASAVDLQLDSDWKCSIPAMFVFLRPSLDLKCE